MLQLYLHMPSKMHGINLLMCSFCFGLITKKRWKIIINVFWKFIFFPKTNILFTKHYKYNNKYNFFFEIRWQSCTSFITNNFIAIIFWYKLKILQPVQCFITEQCDKKCRTFPFCHFVHSFRNNSCVNKIW
jgi:hypothetical protein